MKFTTMRNFTKVFIITMVMAMIARQALAQEEEKTFNYKLLVEVPVVECDIEGNILDETVLVAPREAIFTKLRAKNADTVIVRFWDWETGTEKYNKFNFTDKAGGTESEQKYFLMLQKEFDEERVIPRYSSKPSFTAGTLIVPIKIRFNEFDFSKDFTLGPTVGMRFRLNNYSENFGNVLVGLGVTSVTLDSASTEGTILKTEDRPALTPSLGFLLEFNTVQVGLFTGIDYISDNSATNWNYHGKPWVSLGLGYTILTRQSKSKSKEDGKQSSK